MWWSARADGGCDAARAAARGPCGGDATPGPALAGSAIREHHVNLMYAPTGYGAPLRVARRASAVGRPWQRVTHALARAVAVLARELHWAAVAAHYR